MTAADDRAGGKELVDAMFEAYTDLYKPLSKPKLDLESMDDNDVFRAHARFILLGLQERGYMLHRHYTSTSCMHGLHTMCGEGLYCSFCSAGCQCECHREKKAFRTGEAKSGDGSDPS